MANRPLHEEVCSAKVRNLGEKVGRHGGFMFIRKILPRLPMAIVWAK